MKSKLLVTVAVLGVGLGVCASFGRGDSNPNTHSPPSVDGDTHPAPAPEFIGVTDWVNSKPLKLADQKGKVVIVHFWTNGCINCIHNYPHYRAWTEKYKDNKDLLIVGIHTPEFDAEKDVDRIKAKAEKNHLTFAIAVDNKQANWQAWGNRYWPCVYLVDKAGNVRYHWEGELGDDGYKKVTRLIDELLAEKTAKSK
ncbi:MAG TPA: redoxin domain-containing protein [Gemmataceae bacterium]|jgi:peroxiredoxin|nr:redoxin domain-containing protein [Gemmataceae bacterium]